MQRTKTVSMFSRFNPDKRLFALMLVAIVVIPIDSQIGYVVDFIPEQLSSNVGVFTFVVIAVIFVITQYLILDYVKKSNKEARKRVRHISKLHTGVTVVNISLQVWLFPCKCGIDCFTNTINTTIQYYNSLYCVCNKLWAMDLDFGSFNQGFSLLVQTIW